MPHLPANHFLRELVVPLPETAGLQKIQPNVVGYLSFSLQVTNEHVALNVFAKQVFVAHDNGIDHPHSHLCSPAPNFQKLNSKEIIIDSDYPLKQIGVFEELPKKSGLTPLLPAPMLFVMFQAAGCPFSGASASTPIP